MQVNWSALSVVLAAAISAGGTAFAVNRSYFDLVSDVRSINEKNTAQDERMSRIEHDQTDQRASTNEKLRDISSDLKEVRNYLLDNAAGSRPDTRRWSR
ncbi:hypothetical protein [Burkholderia gladioli]|uniref:hypothetical protein n=1 Tax=Burkholderia gladioli TaxID=28095 RepID=UPI0016409B03|nr:hypothetical protein [Burkholderia gladioli]